VAVASSLSGLFIFFVAQYTRLRGELVRSEKELNLTQRGQLAATRLGRAILLETLRGAFISSMFNLLGAFIPIASGLFFPAFSWLTIVFAIAILGILGGAASRFAHGNPVLWSIGLVAMGILLTFAGIELHIT
jgi:predicted membrane protein (TIGR00267 family)